MGLSINGTRSTVSTSKRVKLHLMEHHIQKHQGQKIKTTKLLKENADEDPHDYIWK